MMDIIKINICVFYYFQIFENFIITSNYVKNRLQDYFSFSKISTLFENSFSIVIFILESISFLLTFNENKDQNLILLILKKDL